MRDDWLPYATLHPEPGHTVTGDLRVLPDISGDGIPPRDLLVLLPPGAGTAASDEADPGRRWPVLYMLDGQNLFDAATSFAGEWRVDETMATLASEGIEAIIVGIPHAGDLRFAEYTPWATGVRAYGSETGSGGATLRYLVDVVKPLVDEAFPTASGPACTGLAGSSLGGLMAAYGAAERPDIFGLVGAFSPALGFGQRKPLFAAIGRAERPPVRAWIDMGTHEAGRKGDGGSASTSLVASAGLLRDAYLSRGLRDGVDLRLVIEAGGIHHESAWARRLPEALRFLLGHRPV